MGSAPDSGIPQLNPQGRTVQELREPERGSSPGPGTPRKSGGPDHRQRHLSERENWMAKGSEEGPDHIPSPTSPVPDLISGRMRELEGLQKEIGRGM